MSKKNEQATSFGTESITQESRQSWVKICFVWLGLLFAVSTMMQGGVVGTQLPLGEAFVAIIIANPNAEIILSREHIHPGIVEHGSPDFLRNPVFQ